MVLFLFSGLYLATLLASEASNRQSEALGINGGSELHEMLRSREIPHLYCN